MAISIFSLYRTLHPWDHAAGVLLHNEAGGFSGLIQVVYIAVLIKYMVC